VEFLEALATYVVGVVCEHCDGIWKVIVEGRQSEVARKVRIFSMKKV